MTTEVKELKLILEGALMAAGEPLTLDRLQSLFEEHEEKPNKEALKNALSELANDYEDRSVQLCELASGYTFRVGQAFAPWIARLWQERAPKYSRAILETLALIAYRQPITRSEIEDVRGVAVSSHIIRTLMDRSWIRVVGHRDVPGRPSLFATTKEFLDHFSLTTLNELPMLEQAKDVEEVAKQLELEFSFEGVDVLSKFATNAKEDAIEADDESPTNPVNGDTAEHNITLDMAEDTDEQEIEADSEENNDTEFSEDEHAVEH